MPCPCVTRPSQYQNDAGAHGPPKQSNMGRTLQQNSHSSAQSSESVRLTPEETAPEAPSNPMSDWSPYRPGDLAMVYKPEVEMVLNLTSRVVGSSV